MKTLVTTLLLVAGLPALAETNAALRETIDGRLEAKRDELIEVRRDLHRHPELSGAEQRTAGIVARRLEALGFAVERGVGGHGVVAVLAGGKPGPLVAFRADMDAVTSGAPDPVPFKSENAGVRHICGHDIHTTIGLALAEGLAAVQDRLAGSVMLVFQPAEENATGARAMLADGAFDPKKPAAIFAFHTAPMPVGTLITSSGTLMSWRDRVDIALSGEGDVEAMALKVKAAIDGLRTIEPAQATAPTSGDFRVVNVGSPTRGADGRWTLRATITTATDSASDAARETIARTLASLESAGAAVEWTYEKKWVAGVTNDAALAEHAIASARTVLGEEAVATTSIVVPAFSEDFGSFQQRVPGVMFFLGVSNPDKGWVGMPHTPNYVADEESIFVGARSMAAVLLDYLERGRG